MVCCEACSPAVGALVGGARLRCVDRDQHLSAADVIAFVHVDARDGSHHLAGELRRLRRAHRAGGFDVIGNSGALRGEERDAGDRFGSGSGVGLLAGAARTKRSDDAGEQVSARCDAIRGRSRARTEASWLAQDDSGTQ